MASRKAATIRATSAVPSESAVAVAVRRIGGARLGRCHRAALASISAKSEPVTKAKIELISGSEGWGIAREPASTSFDCESGSDGFIYRPQKRFARVDCRKCAAPHRKSLRHARRETEIDRQRESDAGCEYSPREWIKNGGVDQPSVRRQANSAAPPSRSTRSVPHRQGCAERANPGSRRPGQGSKSPLPHVRARSAPRR